jgi:hypothetical protein
MKKPAVAAAGFGNSVLSPGLEGSPPQHRMAMVMVVMGVRSHLKEKV